MIRKTTRRTDVFEADCLDHELHTSLQRLFWDAFKHVPGVRSISLLIRISLMLCIAALGLESEERAAHSSSITGLPNRVLWLVLASINVWQCVAESEIASRSFCFCHSGSALDLALAAPFWIKWPRS